MPSLVEEGLNENQNDISIEQEKPQADIYI
jgi:hypothetical protein